ncbi:hypothetical protein Ddc_14283 [Ditylenchus destructor]|nr:hypothetical protein Ddc_14283 [Ditylenchus destructor]
MASIRKTAVIFLFFFAGFGVAELFGYSNTLRTTDLDYCEYCVTDCVRVLTNESAYKCDPEDRACLCSSVRKGIHCMKSCPDSTQHPDCPYIPLRKLKKYYSEALHCPGPVRKLA